MCEGNPDAKSSIALVRRQLSQTKKKIEKRVRKNSGGGVGSRGLQQRRYWFLGGGDIGSRIGMFAGLYGISNGVGRISSRN